VDPEPAFYVDADPDPAFHFATAHPDPAFHSDPDLTFQFDADPNQDPVPTTHIFGPFNAQK
jgi:hypothetical protein